MSKMEKMTSMATSAIEKEAEANSIKDFQRQSMETIKAMEDVITPLVLSQAKLLQGLVKENETLSERLKTLDLQTRQMQWANQSQAKKTTITMAVMVVLNGIIMALVLWLMIPNLQPKVTVDIDTIKLIQKMKIPEEQPKKKK